ncbi:MAG TPA: radical SAM protein [Elusimicrobiales bacterium]|nr:radical SAM protein [Elusimicrobiales bacterium]
MASVKKPVTILEAVKKFGWPEPGSKIISHEVLLGERCNARCLFCCAKDMNKAAAWLPYGKLLAELDAARARDAWLVTFSGGEATLYPHLERAARAAKKAGFRSVQLLTNGFKLAEPAYAARLAAAGFDEIKVSMHGVDSATHDRLVGVPGAYKKALKAVANLNRLGVKASFNFAVTRANYRQMPLFARFAGTELGLTGFCYMFSFYAGAMLEENNGLSVSYAEALPYLKHALEYMALRKITVESKMLSNFPPCAAPEYANLMSDWGAASPEAGSRVSRGARARLMPVFYSSRKVKPGSCRGCVNYACCYGVDAGYLDRYGSAEFRPLKKMPKKFPLVPLYP